MTILFTEHDRRMVLYRLFAGGRVASQQRVTEVLEQIEFSYFKHLGDDVDRQIELYPSDL